MKLRSFFLLLSAVVLSLPCGADEPKKEPAKPAPVPAKKMESITLAAGCFWCTEVILQRVKGVETVVSGYTNGHVKNPTYDQVCEGDTGHAEAVQVTFDPSVLPLEKLLHIFFELHDPTTLNRQGPDQGTQYRSGIYFQTDAQKAVAEKVKAEVDKSGKYKSPIVTEIVKVDNFNKAENYHQNYFEEHYLKRTGNYRYCNGIIIPKLKKMGLLKPDEKKAAGEE
jgi:peptide-methionine (S)-S-oxide reductase